MLDSLGGAGRDLAVSVERGDIRGASFAFTVAPGGDQVAELTRQRGPGGKRAGEACAASGLADGYPLAGMAVFGRRVAENGSAGTDHGKGSVMFALGQGVRGGIHGSSPDLEDLDQGDIKYRQDFRGVYAGALRDWLGLDARGILGGDFAGPGWVA